MMVKDRYGRPVSTDKLLDPPDDEPEASDDDGPDGQDLHDAEVEAWNREIERRY